MGNPLINLEKLSEPLTKLVDVISRGIGTLYAPFGTVRQAKADAEAKTILAKADAEVLSLHRRAQLRLEHREALRQQNIERIALQAACEMPDKVSAEPVDEDWIVQFFNNAQDVGDEDMQTIWARILAGETSSPGRYSKRTLDFLKSLDKWEAEGFSKFCSFAFREGDGSYFIFEDEFTVGEMRGMFAGRDYMGHFINIGLMSPEPLCLDVSNALRWKVRYFEQQLQLREGTPGKFELFRYFSSIGNQLASIAGAKPIDGYIKRLSDFYWAELQVKFEQVSS